MHAWLLVLAVLAILQNVTQLASTEGVNVSSSAENNLENSYLDNNSLDSNLRVTTDNDNSNTETSIVKPDRETLVQVEKSLLSLFGFPKRPKVDRSKVVIPEAMKQLYAQIMGHDLVDSVNVPKPGLHTKNANTVRSFTHEESHVDNKFKHHHKFRLLFNITNIPDSEKLKAAELTLSRDAVLEDGAKRIKHQVLVYDIIRPGIKGKREPVFLLIDTKSVTINSSSSISLDVMPAVERWIRSPKKNFGIFIHISADVKQMGKMPEHPHIRLRRSIDEPHDSWSHKQPLLFTYTDDGRHKQRHIRDAISNSNSNRARRAPMKKNRRVREMCRRKPLYVDFNDVGWSDWIVAPPGYDAYYCAGDCQFPIADHLNTTNHAIVQTLVNSINPSLAPKACCVPTQLSSISMLYLNDQNKVVLKNYQDMTVVGCGCR